MATPAPDNAAAASQPAVPPVAHSSNGNGSTTAHVPDEKVPANTTIGNTGGPASTPKSTAVIPLPTPKGGPPSRQTSETPVRKLAANTESKANVVSRWTFWYLNPLLSTAARKMLEDHDVSDIYPGDDTRSCVEAFDREWVKEVPKPYGPKDKNGDPTGGPQLKDALRRAFGDGWWRGQIAYAIYTGLTFVPSLVLKALVANLEGSNELNAFQEYALAVAVMVLPLIGSLLYSWHNQFVTRIGYRARSALTAAIYRKSLKLSSTSRAATSVGLIVNIMTNDATKVKDVTTVLNQAWAAPLMLLIAVGLLYWQVRQATFVGLGFMISLIPIQGLTFKKVGGLIGGLSSQADLRVKYVNEVLMGIRVIKMYGWESAMRKRIFDVRANELKMLRTIAYTISFGFLFVLLVAPLIMPILVFITYIKTVEGLTASVAFSTLSFFGLIRTPFVFLPMVLQQVATTKIALARITRFLLLEELDSCNGKPLDAPVDPQNALTIENGNFVWSVPKKADELANMKAPAQFGGPGSQGAWRGGQMAKKGGPPGLAPGSKKAKEAAAAAKKGKDAPTIALGAPVPGGKPGDKDKPAGTMAAIEEKKEPFRLKDVNVRVPKNKLTAIVGAVGSGKTSLMSCMLREMSQESGDLRSTGSIAYSAQQPWIVNRSLRDNIIFDLNRQDEQRYQEVVHACALELDLKQLPAGDATEIGERGINLSGGQKARVGLARAVYQIADSYFMDDPLSAVDAHVGEHIFHKVMLGYLGGKTRVLVTNHIQFLDKCDHIILIENGRVIEQGSFAELRALHGEFDKLMAKHGSGTHTDTTATSGHKGEKKSDEKKGEAKKPESKSAAAAKAKLVSEEERNQGDVSWTVYKYYLSANGFHYMFMIIFGYALAQGLQVQQSFALADWTNAMSRGHSLTDGQHTDYLLKYMAWGLAAGVVILLRSFPFAEGRIRASRALSQRLLDRILRAPMRFFDTTPVGRILNRFSRDVDGVDMQLPPVIAQSLSTAMSVIASIVAISISTKAWFLIPCAPIMVMYYFIQKYYRRSSTEMQRLASISRSPVYTHFTETLNGLSTIRASGASDQFRSLSDRYVDMNTRIEFTGMAIQNWLSLRLDLIGSLISFAVAIIAVASDIIPAGWAGVGLNYAFELTGNLKFGVRTMADTESRMNSVERIQHYTMTTEQEAPLEAKSEAGRVGPNWPENGKVEIRNLVLEYKPDTPVLKGISATIPARAKVGLAGRTGSGKSTMMLALLRLVEARSGQIFIDDVEIAEMGLQDLRSRLAIIPQDPVLFSDSIQRNIDPFDQYGKDEVLRVLKLVHLDKYVESLQDGVGHQVSEGGENFSVGQRQLICMARALLRRPRVLLLDEATASIDVETDFQMQLMLRTHFKDCTVITIAHRLKTIMDSDLIMVLDHGHIIEFDKPAQLLKNPNGMLSGMVDAHGPVYASVLRALATGSMHFEAALRQAAIAESGGAADDATPTSPTGANGNGTEGGVSTPPQSPPGATSPTSSVLVGSVGLPALPNPPPPPAVVAAAQSQIRVYGEDGKQRDLPGQPPSPADAPTSPHTIRFVE